MASSRIKRGKITYVTVNRSGEKIYTSGQGIKLSMFSKKDLLRMAGNSGSNKTRVKVIKELSKRFNVDYAEYVAEQAEAVV